jgi:hypothetical protein
MAHHCGRERTWCESFAASGWGLTFQEMRRIVNWEHVNGINMQIPISFKCSMRGPNRAAFYGPGISYQQPWWDHFRGFADCEARLCLLASGGGHVAPLLLLYPEDDIRAHCWDHDLLTRRSDAYNAMGDRLRREGYDFDILDAQAIVEEARVEEAHLATEHESFSSVIIPRVDTLRRSVLERCQELVESGGQVIFVGGLPHHSRDAGSDDPRVRELLINLLGADCHERAERGERIWHRGGEGRAGFAPEADDLVEMIRETIPPDVTATPATGELFAYHRMIEGDHLYLLFNRAEERAHLEVTLSAKGQPEIWDPVTGDIEALTDHRITETGTRITLLFHPGEIIPVLLRATASEAIPRVERTVTQEIPLDGPFRFHVEKTMARPHVAWNFTQREDGWTSVAEEMVVPDSLVPGDWCDLGLRFFSGIGVYETEVELGQMRPGERVILDLGQVAVSAEVSVNGQPAGLVFFEPRGLDITERVLPGMNRLRIAVANTLANYFSQFEELQERPLNEGGIRPERLVSGLIGPVVIRVMSPA